jgi:hypothetical protein
MRRLAPALVLLVACKGGEKKEGAPEAGRPAPVPVATAGNDAAGPVKPPDKAKRPEPIPPEKRREYLERLRAGRAHAKGKRWGEAVTEFEAALAAVPMDDRALSELGWAAFQAGDQEKAEKANADSVRVSSQPDLKAASLYNLGRVAEEQGDRDRAAALYTDSLVLRPNKAVVKRLVALGKPAPKPDAVSPSGEATPCTTPVEGPDLVCDCLKKMEAFEEDFAIECTIGSVGDADDLRMASVTVGLGSHEFFLAQQGDKGWRVIGGLGDLYEGGVAGVFNEREDVKVEEKTIGGARILWYEWREIGHDSDMGIDEEDSHEHVTVALAVLGGAKEEPGVRMHIPLVRVYDRDRMGLAEARDLADMKDLQTPGLPIHREARLKVDIGEDGMVKVVLLRGKADDDIKAFLGSRRLFTPK